MFNYALVIFLLAIIGIALREQALDALQNGLTATDHLSEVQSYSGEDTENNDVKDNELESKAVHTTSSTPDNDETT